MGFAAKSEEPMMSGADPIILKTKITRPFPKEVVSKLPEEDCLTP